MDFCPERPPMPARRALCLALAAGAGTAWAGGPRRIAAAPAAVTPQVLHVFHGDEGQAPFGAPVQAADGALYGLTEGGNPVNTLYRLVLPRGTRPAVFDVVHRFSTAELTDRRRLALGADGRLYGVIPEGGGGGAGQIFSFDPGRPSGQRYRPEVDLVSDRDGAQPNTLLALRDGSLLGSCRQGGLGNAGTVFLYRPGSAAPLQVLGHFGGRDVAQMPYTELVAGPDAYYGTTLGGGAYGGGTVYRIDPASGAVTIVLSFGRDENDGQRPAARMVAAGGWLYGKTEVGGGPGKLGTLYRVDPRRPASYAVLHAFSGGDDGATSDAGMLVARDAVVGSTPNGGAEGVGSLYSVAQAAGTYRPGLFSFPFSGELGGAPGELMLPAGSNAAIGVCADGGADLGQGTIYRIPG